MPNTSGLRRKIWVAFILQAATISFAAVLGVYGASAVLKHVLIQRALQQEAAHFWHRLQLDPRAEMPDTYNMTGYLLPPQSGAWLPPALRPQRAFVAVDRPNEDLQTRHAGLTGQRSELGVQLRRHTDTHLRIIAYSLSANAARRPAGFPDRCSCHT